MLAAAQSFGISALLGGCMLLAGILSRTLTPDVAHDMQQHNINLEAMIPRAFSVWKVDPSSELSLINPDPQGLENKIYNQTLARTYINPNGKRIMLSIAYGNDQSTDLQIHRPEVCYTAGGFQISGMNKTFISTSLGELPVMQLVATQGLRKEPITYWIRVGDTLTRGWIQQKLTAIAYSLTGKIPDGLLFRVSAVSEDTRESFLVQQEFTNSLLQAIKADEQYWLVGHLYPQNTQFTN